MLRERQQPTETGRRHVSAQARHKSVGRRLRMDQWYSRSVRSADFNEDFCDPPPESDLREVPVPNRRPTEAELPGVPRTGRSREIF